MAAELTLPSELTSDYPLPWRAVLDVACARIVAANGATVLACAPDEGAIARFVAHRVSAPAPCPLLLQQTIDAMAAVLRDLGDYPTDADFVDALIVAAEAVIAGAARQAF